MKMLNDLNGEFYQFRRLANSEKRSKARKRKRQTDKQTDKQRGRRGGWVEIGWQSNTH